MNATVLPNAAAASPVAQDAELNALATHRPWHYRWAWARADLLAALTVAAISLPQSIAYALIAGVDPRFGLYSAIVFTAVAGVLGSSRHLINGPTGAVSLVVFSALAFIEPEARLDAYEAMALLAVLIGTFQIAIAVLRLGDLTRYISESVVTGFITGAATLTIIGQVANALGVKAQGSGHQHVLARLWLTLTQNAPFNPRAIAISVSSVVLALLARRLVRRYKLPALDMFVVLILVSAGTWALGWSDHGAGIKPAVSLIEAVPASLPSPHVPEIQWRWLWDLGGSAASIAVLGLLEALAIAKAIAQKTRQPLDYNRQILAEGVGNLVGGFFRCIPGAGSLSRTAINHQAGAVTRFSGLFTALIVAAVVLAAGPLTAYIPKAALAGLLLVAAARLIDLQRLRYVIRGSRYDAVLLIATALTAVFINIEVAILIGVLLSVLWYVPRAAQLKSRELVVTPERVVRERLPGDAPPRDVLILDLEGELFFGAAPDLARLLGQAEQQARDHGIHQLVLRVKRVRNPDVVTLEVLETFLHDARRHGLTVLLAGVRPDLRDALRRLPLTDVLPDAHVFVEEDEDYSATLKAIRAALARRAAGAPSPSPLPPGGGAYYLV